IVRLWPYTRESTPVSDVWIRTLARMVVSCIIGFLVAAHFLTADLVEVPLYIALLGAGTLSIASQGPQHDVSVNRRQTLAVLRPRQSIGSPAIPPRTIA